MSKKIRMAIAVTSMLVSAIMFAAIAAEEVTVTTLLRVKNGQYDQQKNVANLKVDQGGNTMSASIQNIQTGAWEVISISADVTTNGYAFFRNLSDRTNNYIDVGTGALSTNTGGAVVTNFSAFMRLGAKQTALMPLHITNLVYARAFSTNASTGLPLENWINQE